MVCTVKLNTQNRNLIFNNCIQSSLEENDGFGNFLSQAFQKPTEPNVSESEYLPLDKQLLNLVAGKFVLCPYVQAESAMCTRAKASNKNDFLRCLPLRKVTL